MISDTSVFRSLNSLASRSATLDAFMVAGARYAILAYIAMLVALWVRWRPREQRIALLAAASVGLALGIGQLLGMAFPHPRPFDTPGLAGIHVLVTHAPDSGFPSDHATLAFATTAVLWTYRRAIGVLCFVIGVWIAVARVYVGVHFPSDVLGGALLGAVVGAGLLWFSDRSPLNRVVDMLLTSMRHLHLAADPARPDRPATAAR